MKQGQPQLASAREKSDTLAAEAKALRNKLIETAARIESLERARIAADTQIEKLEAENKRLSAGFANDRVAVTRLLAVLQRLQHDMPPALGHASQRCAGRGARRHADRRVPAAGLCPGGALCSRRIEALKRTRAQLDVQRREAAETGARLTAARAELDVLSGAKGTRGRKRRRNLRTP